MSNTFNFAIKSLQDKKIIRVKKGYVKLIAKDIRAKNLNDEENKIVTKILLNEVEVYYTISEFATNFDLDRTARPCSIEIFEINPRTDAWGRKINE